MKPLLLIGQPGHELKILEWLKTYQPDIVILTKGEGSTRSARLDQSLLLLHELGLQIRTDYLTPLSDEEVYETILAKQGKALLKMWFDSLHKLIKAEQFTALVSESAEGCNLMSELCRILANQLSKQLCLEGYELLNLEFPLIKEVSHNHPPKMEMHLNPEQLKDKMDLARHYAQGDQRFAEKIETAFLDFGETFFKIERLYPAQPTDYEKNQIPISKPEFEIIGEQRQQEGIYKTVITSEHLRKMVQQFQQEEADIFSE